MRTSKSNRVFLAVVTLALMCAGTGLTIANNWENDLQIAAIAVALSASFLAAEFTFLWGHKVWEHLRALWRKVVLGLTLAALVLSMAAAVWSELEVALSKLSNRAVAQNIGGVLEKTNASATSRRERERNTRAAFAEVAKGKIDFRVLPFVICYALAGLTTIVILAVQVAQKQKRQGGGDQVPANPIIAEKAKQIGMAPPQATVKAYADRNGGGYSIWVDGKYAGYLPKADL